MEPEKREISQVYDTIKGAALALARAEGESAHLQSEFDRVEGEKLAMMAAHREAIGRAKAEMDGLSDDIVNLRGHVEVLEKTLSDITASPSWKVTWPLRYLSSKLGKGVPGALPARPPEREKPREAPAAAPAEEGPCILTPRLPAGQHPAPLAESVSFIIPVYNGGGDLERLLEALIWQEGLEKREIVVVDSGSSDGSDAVAEGRGTKVVRLAQAEFTHAHARNLGARNATGDFLVFLTQDAMPTGPWWARNVLEPLRTGAVDAVSCTEQPREDADFYYALNVWHHNRLFMAGEGEDRIGRMPEKQDIRSLRENASLINVASALPASLLREYPFRRAYGEDLDLGLRLLRGGHSIGFLSSERIIHSHDRPVLYQAKRGFVDMESLLALLPEAETLPLEVGKTLAVSALQYCLAVEVRAFIEGIPDEELDIGTFRRVVQLYLGKLAATPAAELLPEDGAPPPSGEADFDALLRRVWTMAPPEKRLWAPHEVEGAAEPLQHFAGYTLRLYLEATETVAGRALMDAVGEAFVKFYAWDLLGQPAARLAQQHPEDEALLALAADLRQGV